MTKDEIYEHLAKVYLGKKKKKKKTLDIKFYALLFINIFVVIGIGSFLFRGIRSGSLKEKFNKNNVYFAINQYPLRLQYNFVAPYPQIENFTVPLPTLDVRPYRLLEFSIRAEKNSIPSIIKITLENRKKETSSYFLKQIPYKWQKIIIPLTDFKEISDWTNITKLHFVFEAWNIETKRGSVLIDDICFSN